MTFFKEEIVLVLRKRVLILNACTRSICFCKKTWKSNFKFFRENQFRSV